MAINVHQSGLFDSSTIKYTCVFYYTLYILYGTSCPPSFMEEVHESVVKQAFDIIKKLFKYKYTFVDSDRIWKKLMIIALFCNK